MDKLTWAAVAACLALVVALCTVASFYLGRRKAATDDGEAQGRLDTDVQYIKEAVRDNVKAVDGLTAKLDAHSAQREKEYRDMLVKSTELSVKYDLLNSKVLGMEKEIAHYHHN
jgi:hypothetical protein